MKRDRKKIEEIRGREKNKSMKRDRKKIEKIRGREKSKSIYY